MNKKQILIFGYYGFENTGDDAVLKSMLHDFRNQFYDSVSIIVFSNNPDKTEEQYKKYNITCIKWDNYELLNFAISQSDLLVIGGGGLYNCYLDYPENLFLKGNHSYFSIITFELPLLAKLHNVPCMVYGVGASEILSEVAKMHIAEGLKSCAAITVRDEKSKEILQGLPGCATLDIEVTADPVFRLNGEETSDEKEFRLLQKIKELKRPILGISLRNWEATGDVNVTLDSVSSVANDFCKQYDGSIVFLPFDNGGVVAELSEDRLIFAKLREKLDKNIEVIQLDGYLGPQIASKCIKLCDITLCMRLHPAIMSLKNSIPVIGLVYDQKVQNIMNRCGLGEFTINLDRINEDTLKEKLFSLYLKKEVVIEKMNAISKDMKRRAFKNIEIVETLLEQGKELLGSRDNEENLTHKMLKDFFISKNFEGTLKYKTEQFDAANYQEVIRILSLIKTSEMDGQLLYELAFALHQCQKYEDSIRYYDLALQKGFDEFWIRYNKGQLLCQIGREKEGKEELLSAFEINPKHEGIRSLLK